MKSAGIHSLFKRLRRRMEDAPGDCDNLDGGVNTLEARHGYDKNGAPATQNTSWQQKDRLYWAIGLSMSSHVYSVYGRV